MGALQLTAEKTGFFAQKNWLLAGIGSTVLLLALWMVIETVIVFVRGTGKETQTTTP